MANKYKNNIPEGAAFEPPQKRSAADGVSSHAIPKGPTAEVEAVKQQLESVLQNLSTATKDSLDLLKAFKEVLDARVTGYVTSNAKLQEGELLATPAARQARAAVPTEGTAKKLVAQKDTTLDNLVKLKEQNEQIAKDLDSARMKVEHAAVLAKGKPLLQKEELETYTSKMNGILERVNNMNQQIKNVVQEASKDSPLAHEQQLQIAESAYQSHMHPDPATRKALEQLMVGHEGILHQLTEMNNTIKVGPAAKVESPAPAQAVEKDVEERNEDKKSGYSGP